MEKSLIKKIKTEEIEKLGVAMKVINSKPFFAIYSCIAISLVLLFVPGLAILGWIILPLALLVLIKIPNQKVISFYEKEMLIHSRKKGDQHQVIEYEHIVEWAVRQGKQGGDYLTVHVVGDEYVNVETFNSSTIFKQLNERIPNKESNKKKNQAMGNTKLTWPWGKKE